MKTADEEGNWSAISNLLEIETSDVPGECSITPSALDFGSVVAGSYGDATFTIANRGAVDLRGTLGGDAGAFSIIQGGGDYTLAPGESLEVAVRYSPAAAGAHSGVIETGDDACTDVACTGTSVAPSSAGCTLFSVNGSRQTLLVDMDKTVVHGWSHSRSGGYSAYLLEDGSLLRTAMGGSSAMNAGGAQGVVERVGPTGTMLWEYTYSTNAHRAHHDIEPMPNGNVLMIAWERKTAAQAAQAGRARAAEIWPDHIIEVQPSGSSGGAIVWEWHAWDHLIQDRDPTKGNYGVVADHPELLDVNMGSASGRGGDILYRWGCPANYDAPGTRVFDVAHCAVWVPDGCPGAGNILVFNNREHQGTSAVIELVPPADGLGNYYREIGAAYGPAVPAWSYTAAGFYSAHLGGCQRLPGGNTLIVESVAGNILEVDGTGAVQWSYARGGEIARALRYGREYAGLAVLGVGGGE